MAWLNALKGKRTYLLLIAALLALAAKTADEMLHGGATTWFSPGQYDAAITALCAAGGITLRAAFGGGK